MTFTELSSKDKGTCNFKWFDKESREMKACGKEAKILLSGKDGGFLCPECYHASIPMVKEKMFMILKQDDVTKKFVKKEVPKSVFDQKVLK